MDDEAWATLGAAIARARREHEARLARHFTQRAVSELETVLQGREGVAPLLAQLATELGRASADAWDAASPREGEGEIALREVWKMLENTWAWADREDREQFVPQLTEDLAEVEDALRCALDASATMRAALDAQPPFSMWPVRSLGGARALHAEALAQIEVRSGIPRNAMLQPEAIEDVEVFVLADEARAAEELEAATIRRAAWSRALYALQDQLPTEMRVDAQQSPAPTK